mmetsp:Transcript_84260/g.148941  ORF Transcript_84260/g.148941 Transcript_84260/m.148941 type:complete len:103 (-) Transcript_84260:3364-3672(-)
MDSADEGGAKTGRLCIERAKASLKAEMSESGCSLTLINIAFVASTVSLTEEGLETGASAASPDGVEVSRDSLIEPEVVGLANSSTSPESIESMRSESGIAPK